MRLITRGVVCVLTAVISCICATSCKPGDERRETNTVPNFADMYRALLEEDLKSEAVGGDASVRRVTLSASDMPLRRFLQYVSGEYDLSIICEETLDGKRVSVDVVDTEIDVVLAYVARRIGAEISRQGNMVFVGNLRREDRGWLVRKARRMSGDDAKKILTALKTETGNVDATRDGIVVVSDKVRVLQSMSSMLDQVEAQPATTWVLQLYLISTSDKFSRELGFDTSATLDMSAVLANGAWKRTTDAKLQAVLHAARSSSDFDIVAEPMMLMVDGGLSEMKDSQKIPIPQKTVSSNGTVTTTGYTYVDTGTIVKAGLREISPRKASCELTVDITQVTGYVEDSPITSGQTFKTTAILESGGTYLVGSLSTASTTKEKSGAFFDSMRKRSGDDGTVMIWLRCYRIRGAYEGEGVSP